MVLETSFYKLNRTNSWLWKNYCYFQKLGFLKIINHLKVANKYYLFGNYQAFSSALQTFQNSMIAIFLGKEPGSFLPYHLNCFSLKSCTLSCHNFTHNQTAIYFLISIYFYINLSFAFCSVQTDLGYFFYYNESVLVSRANKKYMFIF